MKKIFTLIAVALASVGAFAQHYEWSVAEINNNTRFATVDEAVAAGYNTLWSSGDYIGVPAMDLIKNDQVTVSLANEWNYLGKGNGNYAGASEYGYKLICGMNNSTRDGIDASAFADGLNDNKYVRRQGASDQGNDIYQSIIKAVFAATPAGSDPWTYEVTIKANRGGNMAAIYVVDQTKSKMVLQSSMRNKAGNINYDYYRFHAEQGHTYYILCSENASAEIYGITIDSNASAENELLATEDNCTELWTAAMINNNTRFASVEEAVAAGYNTLWSSGDYIGVPAQTLVEGENVKIELANGYNYFGKGGSYAGANKYGYKMIMGMNNSTRDGIDASAFADGLNDNKYVRRQGASDQGNDIYQSIVKITTPAITEGDPYCGRLIVNWSRGGNAGSLYIVDQTKTKMELQDASRSIGEGKNKELCSIVNLYPGRTYYLLCSENASCELYRIGFCDAGSEKYGKLFGTTTGINNIVAAPAAQSAKAVKSIVNGKLVIVKDGKQFNVAGQRM